MNHKKTFDVQIPQITVRTFQPVIQPCLASLTKEQWVLLQTGKVDFSTRTLFAVLVQDVISAVSRIFSKSLKQDVFVCEELIELAMGDTLFHCFANVLGVENKMPCHYSKMLTNLIGKQVANVLRHCPNSENLQLAPILPCATGPFDLFKMVVSVNEVLQSLVAKRTFLCNPQQGAATANGTARRTCVQRVIGQEVCHLTKPLLKNVPDSEYQLMQRETVEDTKKATKGIDPSKTVLMDVHRVNIQKCFVKGLAKASIHRTLVQLRKEYPTVTKVQSSEEIKSFLSRLDSLLEYGESLKFRKDLSILIYHHLTSSHPEEAACLLLKLLYSNIWNRLTYFQTLIAWWVKTQADLHFVVVMRNVEEAKADDKVKGPIKLIVVGVLLMLVRNVPKLEFENIRREYYEHHESIIYHLVDTAWPEIKEADVPTSKFRALVEALFKALCKRCGSEYNILQGIARRDAKVEKLFVSCLKDQLQEKRHSAFSRFIFKCKRKRGH